MGKSSKKSATKVDVVPVPLSGRKGKRTAENEIENVTSAKKQKAERDESVVANKLNARKKQPKKAASSSSEESDISDWFSEQEKAYFNFIFSKKIPTPAKNGSIAAKISQSDTSSGSSSSSESDSDDSDDKLATVVRNGGGQNSSSEDADSDSSDEEVESSGSSESDESSSSDEDDVTKVAPAIAPKGKVSSSDDESDEEEDSSDSDDESEAIKAEGTPAPNGGKPTAKKALDVSSSSEGNSDDGSDDESSDDEPSKVLPSKKVQASNESSSSGESSDEDESDEEENEKQSLKTPNKKDTDVEMVDSVKFSASTFQKTPKTPATREATGSKTLFVANLSFSVEESHVHEFFKEAGEIVDVRFASDAEGNFRGFAHVEFATPEAAQKAMGLHEQELLGRPVRLDVARERERGSFTPQSRENNSFQRGRAQGQSIFVKGFDASLSEGEIRSALQKHFASCGEIARVSIPPDRENGGVKGIAYMDFTDTNGLNAALKKDNSDFGGGYYLNVREAMPRDGNGGRGSGGRDGGRFSHSGGRDGGRRGGRDAGHRGGRGGGHRGGRSGGRGSDRGRGRGSVTAIASGKKITFGDD